MRSNTFASIYSANDINKIRMTGCRTAKALIEDLVYHKLNRPHITSKSGWIAPWISMIAQAEKKYTVSAIIKPRVSLSSRYRSVFG